MGEELLPRFAPVPGGRFTLGSFEGGDDERPPRAVQIDVFHVSAYAITVDQYSAFVRDAGHPPPGNQFREISIPVTVEVRLAGVFGAAEHPPPPGTVTITSLDGALSPSSPIARTRTK